MRVWALCGILGLLAGCARSDAGPPDEPAPVPRTYDDVMNELGRRLERVGRAVPAGRIALARYDLDAIDTLLSRDVTKAPAPSRLKGVDVNYHTSNLRDTDLPGLRRSMRQADPNEFVAAFGRVAAGCNACHRAADCEFIEIPQTPGTPLPRLDRPEGSPPR